MVQPGLTTAELINQAIKLVNDRELYPPIKLLAVLEELKLRVLKQFDKANPNSFTADKTASEIIRLRMLKIGKQYIADLSTSDIADMMEAYANQFKEQPSKDNPIEAYQKLREEMKSKYGEDTVIAWEKAAMYPDSQLKEIPTAEEFLKQSMCSKREGENTWSDVSANDLIEFAKLHVKAALEELPSDAVEFAEWKDKNFYKADINAYIQLYADISSKRYTYNELYAIFKNQLF